MFKNKHKLIYASSLSAIVSVVYVVVITIWAEQSAGLKGWLADLSGHHWVSKSIFTLVIYVGLLLLFYFLTKDADSAKVRKYLNALTWTAILGTGAILLFYTGHYLHWF